MLPTCRGAHSLTDRQTEVHLKFIVVYLFYNPDAALLVVQKTDGLSLQGTKELTVHCLDQLCNGGIRHLAAGCPSQKIGN